MYSDKVMDHFANPRNVGEIPDADGIGKVGNPQCGDVMWLYIKVKDGILTDIKIKTFGCGAAIATSSMITELARGKTIEEAKKIPDVLGEAFQITSDEVLTWEQIYLEAYRALGVAPNVVHIPSDLIAQYWPHACGSLIGDKSNSVVFDNSKIKKFVPGFTCDVSWAEGLRRALAWFDAHPEYQTVDQELDSIFDNLIRSYERVFLT